MKIIQFTCDVHVVSNELKLMMLQQVNAWSRLQRLSNDENYVTAPFGYETWHTHTTNPNLHWADWDAIYSALGDDGRIIADRFLGEGPFKGLLRMTDLLPVIAPGVRLQIVDVADPFADGYLPAPEPDPEPGP